MVFGSLFQAAARAAALMLDQAQVAELACQIHLALFLDGQLHPDAME